MSLHRESENPKFQLQSYSNLLELSDCLGEMCIEHLQAIRAQGLRIVSPHSVTDHFKWQNVRLNHQFSQAAEECVGQEKVKVELSLNDLRLLKLMTSANLGSFSRCPSPTEISPQQLPPVALPAEGTIFDGPNIGVRAEQEQYARQDDDATPILFTKDPPLALGSPDDQDASVQGVSDKMSRRLTVAATRLKDRDARAERRQRKRHVLYGDGPLTDLDHVAMNTKHGKQLRTRVRTLDLEHTQVVSSAFYESKYVDAFGGLKFHVPDQRRAAHVHDGALHLRDSCAVCTFVADRLSIKMYDGDKPRFIMSNNERKIILAMHIYSQHDVMMPFDEFVDRIRILQQRETPTPSTVSEWAQVGRQIDPDENVKVDEYAAEAADVAPEQL
jgi:hypothetical protein